MAAHISPEKRREIENLFKEGKSQSEVERLTGCAKNTVRGIREKLEYGAGLPDDLTVSGVSTLVDAEGKVIQRWIKSKAENQAGAFTVEVLRAAFEGYKGKAGISPTPKAAEKDLLTVYNIADHHLGLYAWAAETGVDYDLAIGERVLLNAMADLVAAAPASETAIVLNLGDFFHADNSENKTARSGNVLDVDTRYSKVLQVGVKLMVACIKQALGKHKKVIVRSLPGNHDSHTALALSVALSCFFSSNPRVTVDLDPSKFFFYQFGKVMLAATHGDMVKLAKFPGVMAAYRPEMWGQTVWRYGYTGHIHNQRSVEENGAVAESFRTLAGKDAWHHGAGYSSGRSMVAITHHVTRGEVYRHTVTARLEAA